MRNVNIELLVEADTINIKASVSDAPHCKNLSIKSISIEDQNTFSGSTPNAMPLYKKDIEGNVREIILSVKAPEIADKIDYIPGKNGIMTPVPPTKFRTDLKRALLFVYVETTTTFVEPVPCGGDYLYSVAGGFYECDIVNEILSKFDSVDCSDNMRFIHSYTIYKALKMYLYNENYEKAIEHYNKYYGKKPKTKRYGCKCKSRS